MKELFNLFFLKLAEQDIPYAITGRTKNYPEYIYSDIDIVIPKTRIKSFFKFMTELAEDEIIWIQTISHESTAYYFVITLSVDSKHILLKPDICSDYLREGNLFLTADYLLTNRVFTSKGFYVLSPDKEFIYYLLKKIDKGKINQEQFYHLTEQWEANQNACYESLIPFFSDKNKKLIQTIFNETKIELFDENLQQFKFNLHGNLRFNVINIIKRLANRVKRVFEPTGLVVAFLGPDGSGKTTVINGVKKTLTEAFRQNKQYHLFPKKTQIEVTNLDPHKLKKRGYIASVLKLLYFLGLYNKGYWSRIYPQKIKSTLVIFDRYYHDILVDPKRYRHGAGKGWTKFIGKFIPKPDLWILLDVPSSEIQKRKSEVSQEETSRQVVAYRELFQSLNNAFIVNANQLPEKVIYDTEEVIIRFLDSRTRNRY